MKRDHVLASAAKSILLRDQAQWASSVVIDDPYDPLEGLADWLPQQELPQQITSALDAWDSRHHGDVPHNRVWAYDIRHPVTVSSDGWVLDRKGRLLARSMTYHLLAPPDNYSQLLRSSRKPHVHLERAISLRDSNEGNYWHWWDDQLSKLYLAETHGWLDKETPILVGPRLWDSGFFQEVRLRGRLAQLNWTEQRSTILVDRLIVLNSGAMQLTSINAAPDWIGSPMPADDPRIFVTRPADSVRGLINLPELRTVLDAAGYEVVDCSLLSVEQQIDIFATASLSASTGRPWQTCSGAVEQRRA